VNPAIEVNSEIVTRIAIITLVPFLLAFIFIFFIFFRKNRENEIRKQQLELELKALRAQISPHFIFNCLNSIHFAIQNRETDKAGDYLLKFSYLTRRILENSSKRWISLEEDLNILRTYLDLERMRSGERFNYTIDLHPDVDPENTAVPMLIVQPFVENAIWHGFHSRQQNAVLNIHITGTVEEVLIQVKDNGELNNHSSAAAALPGKQQSLGSSIVADQIRAIKELEKREASFTSEPVKNENGLHCGTVTIVKLPYIPLN
jgi:LytS/YehU family sensor histidine kinase